jgi:hypothetical protein
MTETADFFYGHAKVSLRQMEFHSPLFASKAFDPSRAKWLGKIFLQDSCAREEPCNFISAIIDSDTLEQAATQSGTTSERLKSETKIPHLSLPEGFKLRCLYGKHRARAAEWLSTVHWWTVSLYHDSKTFKDPASFHLAKETRHAGPFAAPTLHPERHRIRLGRSFSKFAILRVDQRFRSSFVGI